jgi:signal transduction histidine kinase
VKSSEISVPGLPILVVDDDSALIRTLADILRMHGYEADTAGTAREGLQKARAHTPALAVVDLRLPDMDGMELVSRLHELSELTEVVVLTGNASVESAIAALRENSVDYLVKPVQVDRLLQVVSVATERWQRRQAEFALADVARQQAAIARLGQRALSADDMAALITEAAELVAITLDVPLASVAERKVDADVTLLRAGHGWAGADIGRPMSVVLGERGAANGIVVEIPGLAKPYGELAAHSSEERVFSQDEKHFLQAMAHIVGTALQRNRSEAAYRQAQRLEAVGRLAGGVAHDFNNMLTAITGYGEMIRMNLDEGSPLRDDVGEILKAAHRAADLTRQLLAFSRQQVLQPRVVNLGSVVLDMENMLRRLISENIDLVIRMDTDLGLIKADPGQVEQVILNLCVNARDAMPEGGRLAIEASNVVLDQFTAREHEESKPGEYVMLAVTDNGVGMDAETKARIYEPFFTTKSADKGTGLGLATVYGIVKQSDGEIWVYSEVGHGTTFKLFFPRVDEAERAIRTTPTGLTAAGTETVLIAEDEDAVRRLTKRLLEKCGYTVLVASSGAEAQQIADMHRGPIHLLVTDMVMPRMSGRELARRLVAAHPEMRVLFLSGYTDATATSIGLLEEHAAFLQKPFSNDALVRRVRDVLDAA